MVLCMRFHPGSRVWEWPDCTNSGRLFLHKDSWFQRRLPMPRVTYSCLLWQQRPQRVSHCVYMCVHVSTHIVGGFAKRVSRVSFFFFSGKKHRHFSAFHICQSHYFPTKMLHILRQTSLCQRVKDRLINGNPLQTDQHTQIVMWNMTGMWTSDIFGYLYVSREEMMNLYWDSVFCIQNATQGHYCNLFYSTHGIHFFSV